VIRSLDEVPPELMSENARERIAEVIEATGTSATCAHQPRLTRLRPGSSRSVSNRQVRAVSTAASFFWDHVIRFRECILVEDEHGEQKPASTWVGSGRAKMLQRARVTADRAAAQLR
jgi:hypothetical protein